MKNVIQAQLSKLKEKLYEEGYEILEPTISVDDSKESGKGTILPPVAAFYVLKDNTVYLYKSNGTIERIGTKEYWDRIKKFTPEKRAVMNSDIDFHEYTANCGLCKEHKNSTALLNIVATNRCNLRCWYCFFYAEKSGYVYEPTMQQFEKMILDAKRINGYAPPIQITGGEPTIRKDLGELIKLAKSLGSPHIQLNTHSQIVGMKYFLEKNVFHTRKVGEMNDEEKYWLDLYKIENGEIVSVVDELRELRRNGLNTIYTSFDGVSEEINGYKNHYETPFAIEAYHEAGISSIVLVPTIHQGNLKEVQSIVKFAMKHKDKGIKGVNFQPISIVGLASKKQREALRATQSDIVEQMKAFGLKMNDWYPVSAAENLADVVGKITNHDNWVRFYNNEKCGLATYAYVDGEKLRPITEFIDVDGFLKYLYEVDKNLDSNMGKAKILKDLIFSPEGISYAVKSKSLRGLILGKLMKYIKNPILPDGTDLREILSKIVTKGDYSSLGEFHNKFLFFGMMHFMDPYNYDVNRVQRCSIHYANPNGRVVPFCTFNVYPGTYRDVIMKKYKVDDKLYEQLKEEENTLAIKTHQFRKRYLNEIINSEIYKKYYKL